MGYEAAGVQILSVTRGVTTKRKRWHQGKGRKMVGAARTLSTAVSGLCNVEFTWIA